jgi:hypothetical protein
VGVGCAHQHSNLAHPRHNCCPAGLAGEGIGGSGLQGEGSRRVGRMVRGPAGNTLQPVWGGLSQCWEIKIKAAT